MRLICLLFAKSPPHYVNPTPHALRPMPFALRAGHLLRVICTSLRSVRHSACGCHSLRGHLYLTTFGTSLGLRPSFASRSFNCTRINADFLMLIDAGRGTRNAERTNMELWNLEHALRPSPHALRPSPLYPMPHAPCSML